MISLVKLSFFFSFSIGFLHPTDFFWLCFCMSSSFFIYATFLLLKVFWFLDWDVIFTACANWLGF